MAEKLNIHQRLAQVMGEVAYVQKEQRTGMKYTIVSHDAVTAKVRPALLKHGIVYYPVRCEHIHNGNRAECEMTVRFVNIDEPTDFFDVPTFGYGVDTQDKGPGKAMSYAVKYALLKALGLETGDDAEAESIDHSRADPATPPYDAHAEKLDMMRLFEGCRTQQQLAALWGQIQPRLKALGANSEPALIEVLSKKDEVKSRVHDDPAGQAPLAAE